MGEILFCVAVYWNKRSPSRGWQDLGVLEQHVLIPRYLSVFHSPPMQAFCLRCCCSEPTELQLMGSLSNSQVVTLKRTLITEVWVSSGNG